MSIDGDIPRPAQEAHHLLVITQAQPVITRDSHCSHTISLCPPSRVTTTPLIGQKFHRSALIGWMSCVANEVGIITNDSDHGP